MYLELKKRVLNSVFFHCDDPSEGLDWLNVSQPRRPMHPPCLVLPLSRLPPDWLTATFRTAGGGGRSLAILDAGVVNVYQGASAIIFMVDPYRPETLDKVCRCLPPTGGCFIFVNL